MIGIGSSPENVFGYLQENNLNPIVVHIKDKEEAHRLDMINWLKRLHDIPVLFTETVAHHSSPTSNGFEWIDHYLDQSTNGKIAPGHGRCADLSPVPPNLQEKPGVKESNTCPLYEETVFVKNNHLYEKVTIPDILWIEGSGAYCKLNTIKKELLLCINLSTFQKLVKVPYIIRVHRSFIINLHKIDAFEADYVHINGQLIPLGPKYKECLSEVFPYIDRKGIIL